MVVVVMVVVMMVVVMVVVVVSGKHVSESSIRPPLLIPRKSICLGGQLSDTSPHGVG